MTYRDQHMPDGRLWIVRDDQAYRVDDLRRAPGIPKDSFGRLTARLLVDGQMWRTSTKDDPSLPLVDNETVTLCTSACEKPHVAIAHARAYHAGKGLRETITWGRYALPRVGFAVELQDPNCKAHIEALFAEFSPKQKGQSA